MYLVCFCLAGRRPAILVKQFASDIFCTFSSYTFFPLFKNFSGYDQFVASFLGKIRIEIFFIDIFFKSIRYNFTLIFLLTYTVKFTL